jgi:hypothetical protein
MLKLLVRPNIIKRFNHTHVNQNCKECINQQTNALNKIQKNTNLITFITIFNFLVPTIVFTGLEINKVISNFL